jgi:hypothetical protein
MKKKISLDKWAWGLVIAGISVAGVEAITFLRFSTLITSTRDLNANNIALTSAIGGLIGGTAGLFISMASVIFFISALKSQRLDIKQSHQQERSKQVEQTFFNLLENLIKIRERIYQQAALFNEEIRLNINNYSPYKPPKRFATKADFETLYGTLKAYQQFYSEDNLANLFIKDSLEVGDGKLVTNFKDCGQWQEMAEKFYHVNILALKENPHQESYRLFYLEFERVYGHYFRALNQLLKFLKNNECEDLREGDNNQGQVNQRYYEYSVFISSQMSTDELGLFYYDSINSPARLDLLKHYRFMDSFSSHDLIAENDFVIYTQHE